MKLKVLDHLLVTSIRPSVLRAGEVIEVGDDQASRLLKRRPEFFAPHQPGPESKAAPAPLNKMAPPPYNKAVPASVAYDQQNVADLKSLAGSRGVDISGCRTKADLLGALQAADAAARKPAYAALSDDELAAKATGRGIDVAGLESRDDVVAALELADEELNAARST